MTVTLVQISDVHLGRPLRALDVPPEIRDMLVDASLESVRRACELVGQRDAAALLVAGDLFDHPEVEPELYQQVRELFAGTERPVLVSPGNHDAFGPTSVWNDRIIERLGLAPWPAETHVFETRDFSPHPLLDGELIVYGHRVEGYDDQADSPLTRLRMGPEGRHRVLLMHGSRLSGQPIERATLPFTTEQLAAAGADYAAIGHYHRFQTIERDGRILGAYAGIPVPGSVDEDPHGGVLVVTLGDGGPAVEPVPVWPGCIRRLVVQGHPVLHDTEDATGRALDAIEQAGLGDRDIAFVTLTGYSGRTLHASVVEQKLQDRLLHARVHDRTEPDVPAAVNGGGGRVTIESQFLASLQRRIDECEDPVQRLHLEAARHYGLLALRGRTVSPPPASCGTGEQVDAS